MRVSLFGNTAARKGRSGNGFTIVELLIVIVVIGVLAALVLNSFSQAQTKARNTQTIDAVKKYTSAIILYGQDNDSYPYATGGATVYPCLGESYPSLAGQPANRCASVTGAGACGIGSTSISGTFAPYLRPYMGQGTLPTPANSKTIDYCSLPVAGAYYIYNAGTGRSSINFFIEGDNLDCPRLQYYSSQNKTSTATLCTILFPVL